MTIEEIEDYVAEHDFACQQDKEIIRDLLAQVREAEKTAEDWRKYHDAEYADRKKYRKEANELFAELKEARKQAFLEAVEMADSRWDAIGKPQNSIDTGEKVALIMFSRALRRKAEEE